MRRSIGEITCVVQTSEPRTLDDAVKGGGQVPPYARCLRALHTVGGVRRTVSCTKIAMREKRD